MERDYSAKGVKFYYIYKSLAHPEQNGYITPFTLKERLMHVEIAKRELGSRIPWLCDSMSNELKHALGDAPNSEFVVAPDGKIVVSRRWSRPGELRDDLATLVGPVADPTHIEDLAMRRLAPPETAATGIVPRLQLPGRMTPLLVEAATGEPAADRAPLYVKLRAEIEAEYFRNGSGQLYLGFFLDPLYKVHWNNQVAALQFELQAPAGITITPTSGQGPEVKAPADADPREFLCELSGNSDAPIGLTVTYFACDDAETFCKAVTQHYEILLQRDADGGSRRDRGNRFAAGRGGRPDQLEDFRARSMRRFPIIAALDADQDGEISSQEIAAAVQALWELDENGDRRLTPDEWRSDANQFQRGRPGRRE